MTQKMKALTSVNFYIVFTDLIRSSRVDFNFVAFAEFSGTVGSRNCWRKSNAGKRKSTKKYFILKTVK